MASVLMSSQSSWQSLFLCQAPPARQPSLAFLCPGGGVEGEGSGKGSLGGGSTRGVGSEPNCCLPGSSRTGVGLAGGGGRGVGGWSSIQVRLCGKTSLQDSWVEGVQTGEQTDSDRSRHILALL